MNKLNELTNFINKQIGKASRSPEKNPKPGVPELEFQKKDYKDIIVHIHKVDYSKTENNSFEGYTEGINFFRDNKGMKINNNTETSEDVMCPSCCCEVTEAIFDNLSSLAVKIMERFPERKEFIMNLRETQRLISQFYVLHEITGKKVIHDNKFIEYFEINN